MPETIFCHDCLDYKKINNSIKDDETFEIKGETISLPLEKYVCPDCEIEIIEEEEYDRGLLKAFNEYRKKNNMLFPHEIREIREKYNLSQRAFSRVLNWGETTINRYENGVLQDPAHDEVLAFIKNPKNMQYLLEKNKTKIPSKDYNKVKKVLKELQEMDSLAVAYLDKLRSIDSRYTGNKMFDIEKITHVITFLSDNVKELYKTKLLKLLWFIEFYNFKKTSVSICGIPFVHLDLGPVPEGYETLLTVLEDERKISKKTKCIAEENIGETIKGLISFDKSLFSNSEIETLEYVLVQIGHYSSTGLVELTHKEKAYLETNYQELIPYEYAETMGTI